MNVVRGQILFLKIILQAFLVLVVAFSISCRLTDNSVKGKFGESSVTPSYFPTLSLSKPEIWAYEGQSSFKFTVNFSMPTEQSFQLPLSVSSQFVNVLDSTVTIPADVTSYEIELPFLEDSIVKGTDTILVQLAPEQAGKFVGSNIQVVKLVDNDVVLPESTPMGFATSSSASGNFKISPDGTLSLLHNGEKLILTDITGTPLFDIYSKSGLQSPTVSFTSDSQWLVMLSSAGLDFVKRDGSQVKHSIGDNKPASCSSIVLVGYHVSANKVVYKCGYRELWLTNMDGSTHTNIVTIASAYTNITAYQLSPDGQYLAYAADIDIDNSTELYLVPTDGVSTPQKVNTATLTNSQDVDIFEFTPNSSKLIWVSDETVSGREDLYSINVNGTGKIRVNTVDSKANYNLQSFKISANSNYVVYQIYPDGGTKYTLYGTTIDGVTEAEITSAGDTFNGEFEISPDSAKVVYQIYGGYSMKKFLRSANISGGGQVDISATPGSTSYLYVVKEFKISPDSNYVVYRSEENVLDRYELYSNAIGGGSRVKISHAAPQANADISNFYISPDSSKVVFGFDPTQDELNELFRVGITGGAITNLYTYGGPEDYDVFDDNIVISSDSAKAYFVGDLNSLNLFEYFSVDLTTNAMTNITPPFIASAETGYPMLMSLETKANQTLFSSLGHDGYGDNDRLYSWDWSTQTRSALMPTNLVNNANYSGKYFGGSIDKYFIYSGRSYGYTSDFYEIYSVDPDGGNFIDLEATGSGTYTNSNHNLTCAVTSDDGQWVGYTGNYMHSIDHDLFVVKTDGTMNSRATDVTPNNGFYYSTSKACTNYIRFTPDNSKILFTADYDPFEYELYSANLDGTGRIRISQNLSSTNFEVSSIVGISPDSNWVLYTADTTVNNNYNLYAAPVAGGTINTLSGTMFTTLNYSKFEISPDSSKVVFTTYDGTQVKLYSNVMAGSDLKELSGTLTATGRVGYFELIDNDRVIYSADKNVAGFSELYSVKISDLSTTSLMPGYDISNVIKSKDNSGMMIKSSLNGKKIISHLDLNTLTVKHKSGDEQWPVGGYMSSSAISNDGSIIVYTIKDGGSYYYFYWDVATNKHAKIYEDSELYYPTFHPLGVVLVHNTFGKSKKFPKLISSPF